MGVGPWVQPIKLSFPLTLKHHAVYYFLCMCPAKKKGFLYRRVTSNQMLFWLSDIFLRIGTGQPPTVVKNLLPTSSCISVRLQIGDIYKLEILSFLSKALSLYVSGDFFFKPFHLKIKFINSKKATKFYEIPTLDLSYVVTVKSMIEIL